MEAINQRSNTKHSSNSANTPWLALCAPASLAVVVGLVVYLAKLSF